MPSGWLPNVQPQQPIASTWGNTIRDRTMTVFDTIAQRDAQLPAPTAGMSCYVISEGIAYLHSGSAWREMYPARDTMRVLFEVLRQTDSGNITTSPANVLGHAFTLTPVAGRTYYARFGCRLNPTAADARAMLTVQGPGAPAGTGYSQWEFHLDSAMWCEASGPLNLPTGAPIATQLVVRAITATQFQLTGAAARPGYYQILERIGTPGTVGP